MIDGGKLEPRVVDTGLANGSMVKINSGLNTGEIISLTPPLDAGAVAEEIYNQFL